MIGLVEDAIQARLKAASDAGVLGYRWATIDSYPAHWDVYFREKTPRAPGVWAVFAGFSEDEVVGFGGMRAVASFGVVVMAENARNETATRQGGPDQSSEPGSYQLVADVIGLLQGQDLGVAASAIKVRRCSLVRTQEIVKERKISMLALELAVPVAFQADAWGMAADAIGGFTGGANPGGAPVRPDFSTFHVDWEAPGTTSTILPDDAHAIAIDNLSLETQP